MRAKRVRPQRPSRFKTKARITGRKVKTLGVKRMETVISSDERTRTQDLRNAYTSIKAIVRRNITSRKEEDELDEKIEKIMRENRYGRL